MRRGDIVVVEHPDRPGLEIVKRVVNVSGDVAPDGFALVDQVWIEGDEPEAPPTADGSDRSRSIASGGG